MNPLGWTRRTITLGGRIGRGRGRNLHVGIEAQQPVTIFLTGEADWKPSAPVSGNHRFSKNAVPAGARREDTYLCDLPENR